MVSVGEDLNITLPQSAVVIDGTGSHDDFGIVSYQWSRSKDSPAAGVRTYWYAEEVRQPCASGDALVQ